MNKQKNLRIDKTPIRKVNTKKRSAVKFAIIVLSIVAIFFIIAIPLAMRYIQYDHDTNRFVFATENTVIEGPDETDAHYLDENNQAPDDYPVPQSSVSTTGFTNVLVMGLDYEKLHTDTIIVASLNHETGKITLISVPRDTGVVMPSSRVKAEQKTYNRKPNGYMKINEVRMFGGRNNGGDKAMVSQVEELLGIAINYYVTVDLTGFISIVDKVDGVTIDVPKDMYYEDPAQNLYINLKKGTQKLTGKQAEMFVRGRNMFGDADITRMKNQQMFVSEMIKQLMSKDTIVKNFMDYIEVLIKYVRTDFDVLDAVKYVKYLDTADFGNIRSYTLPGAWSGKVDKYVCDQSATADMIRKIFFDYDVAVQGDSKSLNIEILNGGSVSGLARKLSEKLTNDGYNVVNYSSYEGTRTSETRIYVSSDGMGADLKPYFSECEIIVDSSKLSQDTDILIVAGTSEK